jgi:hypothetical protein
MLPFATLVCFRAAEGHAVREERLVATFENVPKWNDAIVETRKVTEGA